MMESMYKYFKPGLVHFMAYPSTMRGEGPVAETVKKTACDDYFSAVEITWIKDIEERKRVKNMLAASHMHICYGAAPRLLTTGLNINAPNEEERLKAVDILKEGIDEAYELGAQGFSFLSGRYDKNSIEDALKALIKSTGELCAHAKKQGNMKVILEVFDNDKDKKSLIGPASLARRYAEAVRADWDNFGLMVDLSHLPLIGETAEEAILPVKDFIVHAHIGNTVVADPALEAYGDTHPRFGFPHGANDVSELKEFLKVLLNIGFLNCENPPVVSFEVKPWNNEDADVVLANAKRVLNEAWARL